MTTFAVAGTNPVVAADTVIPLEGSRNYDRFTFMLSKFGAAKAVRLEAQLPDGDWYDVTPAAKVTDAQGNLVFDFSVAAGRLTLRIVVVNNDAALNASHNFVWYGLFATRERFY